MLDIKMLLVPQGDDYSVGWHDGGLGIGVGELLIDRYKCRSTGVSHDELECTGIGTVGGNDEVPSRWQYEQQAVFQKETKLNAHLTVMHQNSR